MNRKPAKRSISQYIRLYERKLVGISIIGLALLGGIASMAILTRSIRMPLLDRVERIIDYWDDRWSRRVEHGERLVSAKVYAQAVEYLETLDRIFPAQSVRHKRDTERERLLRALGYAYSQLDKKRLTLETYQRLAEFDPRNFESRYLLAQACRKFGEPEKAEIHFAAVLKIHPTHLPSVRAMLKMNFDRADFAAVVSTYESYLNAFQVQELSVSLSGSSARIGMPVNGRFYDIDLRIPVSPETAGELAMEVGELALEIKRVSLQGPFLVGQAGVRHVSLWPGETNLRVQEMAAIKMGSYRALGPKATVLLDVPPQPHGVAAFRLTLRLFKPFDLDLWSMVEKSYKNLLRHDDLEAARARSVDGLSTGGAL